MSWYNFHFGGSSLHQRKGAAPLHILRFVFGETVESLDFFIVCLCVCLCVCLSVCLSVCLFGRILIAQVIPQVIRDWGYELASRMQFRSRVRYLFQVVLKGAHNLLGYPFQVRELDGGGAHGLSDSLSSRGCLEWSQLVICPSSLS